MDNEELAELIVISHLTGFSCSHVRCEDNSGENVWRVRYRNGKLSASETITMGAAYSRPPEPSDFFPNLFYNAYASSVLNENQFRDDLGYSKDRFSPDYKQGTKSWRYVCRSGEAFKKVFGSGVTNSETFHIEAAARIIERLSGNPPVSYLSKAVKASVILGMHDCTSEEQKELAVSILRIVSERVSSSELKKMIDAHANDDRRKYSSMNEARELYLSMITPVLEATLFQETAATGKAPQRKKL